jgi:hypothetical protein
VIALASKVKVLLWVLATGRAGLWVIPAHAQGDIHNGPVAIRPMVTAPQLMGKTPPYQRATIVQPNDADSQMANGDDAVHGLTRAHGKERYVYCDKIIATLGAPIHAVGMDCEDALSPIPCSTIDLRARFGAGFSAILNSAE